MRQLKLVKKKLLDLLLIGINLPGINGIDASKFIESKNTCPTILATAPGLIFF